MKKRNRLIMASLALALLASPFYLTNVRAQSVDKVSAELSAQKFNASTCFDKVDEFEDDMWPCTQYKNLAACQAAKDLLPYVRGCTDKALYIARHNK